MMRNILNQHSDIFISPETHYFNDLRPRFLSNEQPVDLTEKQRLICEDYFLKLSYLPYGKDGNPDDGSLSREELRSLANVVGSNADAYFEAFCKLLSLKEHKKIWGEKTPQHIFKIESILSCFPDAHVICMVRDPRAFIASYRDWVNMPRKIGEEERERLRESYNITLQCLLWNSGVKSALMFQKQFGSAKVHIQKYESLVCQPRDAIQNITSWLGLDYQDQMINVGMLNSSFSSSQEMKGVSNEHISLWRHRLRIEEVGLIQAYCSQLMMNIGYEIESVRTPYLFLFQEWIRFPFSVRKHISANRKRYGNVLMHTFYRLRPLLTRKIDRI
jgi:hypothetical protein